MTHPQHQVWELLYKHFPDKADFIVSLIAPYLVAETQVEKMTITERDISPDDHAID